MPRAGMGGSGGGHSVGGSGGGRASGGHSVGGSSRAGTGTGGGGRAGMGMRRPMGMRPMMRGPRYRSGCGLGCGGFLMSGIIAVILVVILVTGVLGSCASNAAAIPSSTVNREKIESSGFINDCVTDELGWVDNVSGVERGLQNFYNETGVQPYVYFKSYDSALTTSAEKEAFAEEWYDDNIDNEYTFLWLYFAEPDDEVGYMVYVNGSQISSVMDSEAVDIFWTYVDEYWYSSMGTDEIITTIFDKTADRIMTKSTTWADVALRVAGVALVIAIVVGIIVIMNTRRKHRREENEEVERILNTPLDQ